MNWGKTLEPVVRERYERETGNVVELVEPIRNPKADWWVGSPDGFVPGALPHPVCLEVKTARFKDERWGAPGTDQIPMDYYIQVQWYMPLLGVEEAHVAVLFSGQDYEMYTVKKDDKCLKKLYKKAKFFWEENVLKDCPPDDMSMAEQNRYCQVKYANFDSTVKDLEAENEKENEVLQAMESLVYIKKEIAQLEQSKSELELKIKEGIGSNKGVQNSFFRATWNGQTRKSMDKSLFTGMVADEIGQAKTQELLDKCTRENTFRVLRLTERKQ